MAEKTVSSPISTSKKPPSTFRRVSAYALVRILTIAATILIGIFFTVIVANKNGGVDASVENDLFDKVYRDIYGSSMRFSNSSARNQYVNERVQELAKDAGLEDPFLKRHIRWTWKVLRLDLGEGIYSHVRAQYWVEDDRDEIRSVILDRLPNTLLIVGLGDFFVFVIGIPLSLYLSRNYGNWFDKIINVLSPLSSVPSWVHGIILILIFSITFHLLPPGGMYEVPIPKTQLGVILGRLKHLVMPVTAIFLSLLFQLVYSWRNFFMIYSNEDYVEFGIAMGLSGKDIQNKYILRPALPYVITSFALTLVSFWQMATALEVVFDWEGIGALYVSSLPNFWGESMFPGEMGLTLGIVVLFAYILGFVVLLLDVAYALVDPRIRLGANGTQVRAARVARKKSSQRRMKGFLNSANNPIKKITIYGSALLVLGLLSGLVFGWRIMPLSTPSATPAEMHRNFQLDYLEMVLKDFSRQSDSSLARARIAALGENGPKLMQELIGFSENSGLSQKELQYFSQNYDSAAPLPAAEESNAANTLAERFAAGSGTWFIWIAAVLTLLMGAAGLYFFVYRQQKSLTSTHLYFALAVFLLIGLMLGVLSSWQIWPTSYENVSPADLRQADQIDYMRMILSSFMYDQDQAQTHARIDALGEDAPSLLSYVIQHPDEPGIDMDTIYFFASRFLPNYPASASFSYPEVLPEDTTNRTVTIGNLSVPTFVIWLAGIAVLAIIIIAYTSIRRSRRAKFIFENGLEDSALDTLISPWQKHWNSVTRIFKEMMQYPSAVVGMIILALMLLGSLYAVIKYPYQEIGTKWYTDASENTKYIPRSAKPTWVNFFRKKDFPPTISLDSAIDPNIKQIEELGDGQQKITYTFTFDYPYKEFPQSATLYFQTNFSSKKPFATFNWTNPQGDVYTFSNYGVLPNLYYQIEEHLDVRQFEDHQIQYQTQENDISSEPLFHGLFMNAEADEPEAIPGTYTLEVIVNTFEPNTEVDIELVLMGEIYGYAGTDYMRRDLVVPMLWGMPFALGIGLFGALLTTIVSMLFAAFGVWYGGWADNLVQRITEANMILPVVAIAVLFYAFYGFSLWTVLTIIVVLNAFGGPTKTFRAAFIQVKEAGYIEAAQAYGAPNSRIIFRYMIPRILPVLIPQLVTLVPSFIFLEATLGMFNVKSVLPTWGKVIYEALFHGAAWGSRFWVMEPIVLLLLTGFAFSMMGFALDRVLNPRLQDVD